MRTEIVVSWHMGFYDKKADPQKCYEEMNELPAITPENVLEKAKDKNSELHNCFEWDDSVAAEKYRLRQAQQVIRFLVCKTKTKEEPIKRVFQISSQPHVYKPTHFFMENPDEYNQLLNRAKSELKGFENRYSSLSEMEPVLDAIHEVLE